MSFRVPITKNTKLIQDKNALSHLYLSLKPKTLKRDILSHPIQLFFYFILNPFFSRFFFLHLYNIREIHQQHI